MRETRSNYGKLLVIAQRLYSQTSFCSFCRDFNICTDTISIDMKTYFVCTFYVYIFVPYKMIAMHCNCLHKTRAHSAGISAASRLLKLILTAFRAHNHRLLRIFPQNEEENASTAWVCVFVNCQRSYILFLKSYHHFFQGVKMGEMPPAGVPLLLSALEKVVGVQRADALRPCSSVRFSRVFSSSLVCSSATDTKVLKH